MVEGTPEASVAQGQEGADPLVQARSGAPVKMAGSQHPKPNNCQMARKRKINVG